MDRAFLKDCLDKGMSLPEIGRLVNRAPGTVGYWVRKQGLVANGSTRFRPGKGLSREPLEKLIHGGKTLDQIAKELQVSLRTVRYWIAKYGLPKPHELRAEETAERLRTGDTRNIRHCRHHGDAEFVMDSLGHWRCRACRQHAVTKRRRKVKRILVEAAGGKCTICGYDRSIAALQFHHLNPAEKRFGIAQQGSTNGIESVREEAAKCVLLCANCHVEVERGVTKLPNVGFSDVIAPRPGLEPGNRH